MKLEEVEKGLFVSVEVEGSGIYDSGGMEGGYLFGTLSGKVIGNIRHKSGIKVAEVENVWDSNPIIDQAAKPFAASIQPKVHQITIMYVPAETKNRKETK